MTNIVTYPPKPWTIGQEFEVGTTTKIWDGEKWVNKSTGQHERRIGELESTGTTLERLSNPRTGQPYFDTDLGTPIWFNGANWVDASGNIV